MEAYKEIFLQQKKRYMEGLKINIYSKFDVLHLCIGFVEALETIGKIDRDYSNMLIVNTILELFKVNWRE